MPASSTSGEHVLHGEHPHDRGRAAEEAPDADGRLVRRSHPERVGGPHPAPDRLGQRPEVALRDVQVRRRPGAAVEVLVAAPDREVDAPGVELDRHRAGRVAQVPEHQGAGLVGDPGQLGHVGQPGRPVRHVAEHHQRGVRADRAGEPVRVHPGGRVDVDPPQRHPELLGDARGDVAVGREVVAVEDDLAAPRPGGHRGAHRLVQQHRGGVADRDLARAPPRARPGRARRPAVSGRSNQPSSQPRISRPPHASVHERREARAGDREGTAQGVAVEVDQRGVGPHEAAAQRRQRVGAVERVGGRRGRRGRQARAMSTPCAGWPPAGPAPTPPSGWLTAPGPSQPV